MQPFENIPGDARLISSPAAKPIKPISFKNTTALLALLVALASSVSGARANVKLNSVFSDNSILQRGKTLPIWGTTAAGERVVIRIAGQIQSAVADQRGRWMVHLSPLEASAGRTLTAQGRNFIALSNVAVGDVYLCSGQSNMEFALTESQGGADAVATADFPDIRLLTVAHKTAGTPQKEFSSPASWQVCTPASARDFSAVAFYFGRELHQKLRVPIGLIDSSWGGTFAEAWTSRQTLAQMPQYRKSLAAMEAAAREKGDFQTKMTQWWARNDDTSPQGAPPGSGKARKRSAVKRNTWAGLDFNDAAWQEMTLPAAWETAGLPGYDGLAWFRKVVDLPASWAGKEMMLHLGSADDHDITFFNGQAVGRGSWPQTQRYRVLGALVKAGRNVIAVRVLDTGGGGGIYGSNDVMRLERAGETPLELQGAWKYRATTPLAQLGPLPTDFSLNPNQTAVLYNAMVAPLGPLSMRGVIWYQGESNAGAARRYRALFPALIRDWRARFGQDLGFYFVQLANFQARSVQPQESQWAELREAQTMALALPRTGMATIIDIGEANDIHPKNKRDVGHRLALAALGREYGQKIESSGPKMQSFTRQNQEIRVRFAHAGGLRTSDGAAPRGFAIAGNDKKWKWATARIKGEGVVLSNPEVVNPTQVRYGWADNPDMNLYNGADLPAVPFRTDAR